MSKYSVGLRNAGSYIVSGQPYITGSFTDSGDNAVPAHHELQVKFPYVTKSITLWNFSAGTEMLRLHLVSSSSITNHPTSKHYYELAKDESLTVNLKCKEVWLSATAAGDVTWKLYASLTNIPTGSMYALAGSGISS
tara:strand:+ start:9569 stop:9979 length:411 start_codon:yes stop_codon:yes gene_type:complete